jgi:hypothetical protein
MAVAIWRRSPPALARRGGRLEVHRRERRFELAYVLLLSDRVRARAAVGLLPDRPRAGARARAGRRACRARRRDVVAPGVGVCAVGGGILLVRGRRPDRAATLFGLAIAATIAGYTLIDNTGVTLADPLAYLEAVMIGPARRDRRGRRRPAGPPALRAGFRRRRC